MFPVLECQQGVTNGDPIVLGSLEVGSPVGSEGAASTSSRMTSFTPDRSTGPGTYLKSRIFLLSNPVSRDKKKSGRAPWLSKSELSDVQLAPGRRGKMRCMVSHPGCKKKHVHVLHARNAQDSQVGRTRCKLQDKGSEWALAGVFFER